ncbi:DEAD-box ATP-dependent RNA helicase FANCM [Impatiens glandulifera]|uniref:DEAD-box ATP-dependent RNA helicase FANCM n=1 Tax=Impatiens glandulifera TaxID=253017 RepID=UPI001FB1706E|nr:DEAD-box ATP-dependent RNA helicase FANCM [Impatiens glandulifera]
MSSTDPDRVIEEDDDEFDWESAVREIDVACQITESSSSSLFHSSSNVQKKLSSSRQSTLDKFIGKAGLAIAPPPVNCDSGRREQYMVDEVERFGLVKIDPETAHTWIYPVNVPLREYQRSITKTALFSNTLVALPTGLGKTLIAAVVMYNYFRWFPQGKIVFAAPSRPLVMQQIEACHNTVGIPQEWTIDMTGQTSPSKRASLWKDKRVFFVTPQVLEKDIQSGTCSVKHIVCLVIDEAHRASGNYSYCVAVRELMSAQQQFRILALTATPGSKQQSIQHIIDNLHITILEYRNESDPDVSPYVHDRKIETIEVSMGESATDVNKMLLEVIRPIVARLSAFGILQNRDYQTLSPCDLLNSRDKFRQAPPHDLHHMKYGEVEGYFGVLITLYHIRKLLSSHGIRPTYEMLEEKLRQGSFARSMSKNETIWKAKLLMQQSLSHGAPSPKLSKMLEVLTDHFKIKDPKKSRVIIFSNFRGSVRDILDALKSIGDFVKATEFIGQSSGKSSKGQSQKAQQAVLEKFRTGGYNIIVATSIGEEGLDIMEVDLVICFDANVSPLRMIQRMGRTGRKHDGRVVVLACQGTELKGYMRKQAHGNAIRKHMRNGGTNSFNFHTSPRMIPHIFKPEVQYVEISIEQFIPRGGIKVKDDDASEIPNIQCKLTDSEADLVAKYFPPTNGSSTWRPSLIAFPHFQSFPSRVHKLMHSFRSCVLVDAMQHLQNLSYCGDEKAFFLEVYNTWSCPNYQDECLLNPNKRVENVEQHESTMPGPQISQGSPVDDSQKLIPHSNSAFETCGIEEQHCLQDSPCRGPAKHSYLFGSDFITISPLGRVVILSVPQLPVKEASHSKYGNISKNLSLNYLKEDGFCVKVQCRDYNLETREIENSACHIACTQTNDHLHTDEFVNFDAQQKINLDGNDSNLQDSLCNAKLLNDGDPDSIAHVEDEIMMPLAGDSINEFIDVDLSPRLTNFIKSGVVPESPIQHTGVSQAKESSKSLSPKIGSPTRSNKEILLESSVDKGADNRIICENYFSLSTNEEIQTPVLPVKSYARRGVIYDSPIIGNVQTPFDSSRNDLCSKEWKLSCGSKSASAKPTKLKRLRRFGDINKRIPREEKFLQDSGPSTSSLSALPIKIAKGKRKMDLDAKDFIEEEAEVSSEFEVSDDEEEGDPNSSDDSFIDDRINPTSNIQPESSEMMAIYRRSLLTQSPMVSLPNYATDITPGSIISIAESSQSAYSPVAINHVVQTPQTLINFSEIMNSSQPDNIGENENDNGTRKRKLSFSQVEFSNHQFKTACTKTPHVQNDAERIEKLEHSLDDDQFFMDVDLDAIQEQAAALLRHKTQTSMQGIIVSGDKNSPTFDLGV